MTKFELKQSGQLGRLKASEINETFAVVKDRKQGLLTDSFEELGNVVYEIKNGSGQDVDRFGVLVVKDFMIDPSVDEDGFINQPYLECDKPAAAANEQAVIVQDFIKDGEMGLAVIEGLAIAKVNMLDADHTYARTVDDDVAKLESCPHRGFRIIKAQSGTGTKLAIVRVVEEYNDVEGTLDGILTSGGSQDIASGLENVHDKSDMGDLASGVWVKASWSHDKYVVDLANACPVPSS